MFDHFPQKATHNVEMFCPICGKSDDKPCVLLGIRGTEEGLNVQATPTHLECLELTIDTEIAVVYMKLTTVYPTRKE